MKQRNYVAKHMNTYNRPSVELDKRNKHLDDAYEKEMGEEVETIFDSSIMSACTHITFTRGETHE